MVVRERSIVILCPIGKRGAFERWYGSLADKTTRRVVLAKVMRLANPEYRGFEEIGDGIFELRIFLGPGYRVYFTTRGSTIVVLLGGGDKRSQRRDINEAKASWKIFKDGAEGNFRKLGD